MGCDIHTHAERKDDSGRFVKIEGLEPFDRRAYGTFGFLAGVRNYSGMTPISEPRDVPADMSEEVAKDYESWSGDAHSASWLSLAELLAFDYDQDCEDRRVTRQTGPNLWNGGCTCGQGEGKKMTFRKFLGDGFFVDLQKLKDAGAERVIFWFDN